jgi:hypothetical protein
MLPKNVTIQTARAQMALRPESWLPWPEPLSRTVVSVSLFAGCGLQDLGDGAEGQPCLVAGAEPGAAAASGDDRGACWDVAAAGEAAWPVSDADQWLAGHEWHSAFLVKNRMLPAEKRLGKILDRPPDPRPQPMRRAQPLRR